MMVSFFVFQVVFEGLPVEDEASYLVLQNDLQNENASFVVYPFRFRDFSTRFISGIAEFGRRREPSHNEGAFAIIQTDVQASRIHLEGSHERRT